MSKPLRWTSVCYRALYEAALDQPNPTPALAEAIEQVRQSRDRATRGFVPEYKEETNNAISQGQQQEGRQPQHREVDQRRQATSPSGGDSSQQGWEDQADPFASWLG